MFTTYGTKKYYEERLIKAKIKETAIKNYITTCCSEMKVADAEILHRFSEVIAEAEDAVKEAENDFKTAKNADKEKS